MDLGWDDRDLLINLPPQIISETGRFHREDAPA